MRVKDTFTLSVLATGLCAVEEQGTNARRKREELSEACILAVKSEDEEIRSQTFQMKR